MRTVGTFTTVVMSVVAAGAAYIGVRSLPDIRRYLKMRSM